MKGEIFSKKISNSTIDLSLPSASCEVITTFICNINISKIMFNLQAVLTFENELLTIIILNQLLFFKKNYDNLLCFTMNRVQTVLQVREDPNMTQSHMPYILCLTRNQSTIFRAYKSHFFRPKNIHALKIINQFLKRLVV